MFGIKELAVILIIVILLFGTKKLKGMGSDLGSAIKGFKKSMSDDDAENAADKPEKLADGSDHTSQDTPKQNDK